MPRSIRIPCVIHSRASMIDTGLEARIIPISLSRSSMNLKIRYTISAKLRDAASKYVKTMEYRDFKELMLAKQDKKAIFEL